MNSKRFFDEHNLVPSVPLVTRDLPRISPLSETQLLICQDVGRGKRVLDLGCGDGAVLRRLNQQCNEVFGVECNSKLAVRAQQTGLRVKHFDLNDGVPFEDDYFDCVVGCDMIDRIFDTRFLFEEVHRVLKPRGFFLFSVPNLNSLANRVQVTIGEYINDSGAFPEDHDGLRVRVFNTQKVTELCRFAGLHINQVWGLQISDRPGRSVSRTRFTDRGFIRRFARPLFKVVPSLSDTLVFRARRIDV